jgi:hypothetical protein
VLKSSELSVCWPVENLNPASIKKTTSEEAATNCQGKIEVSNAWLIGNVRIFRVLIASLQL